MIEQDEFIPDVPKWVIVLIAFLPMWGMCAALIVNILINFS